MSAARRYVYDGFERLCKRIDPEAGGTLFQIDTVGNLIGSAEGQSTSLSCDVTVRHTPSIRPRLDAISWSPVE